MCAIRHIEIERIRTKRACGARQVEETQRPESNHQCSQNEPRKAMNPPACVSAMLPQRDPGRLDGRNMKNTAAPPATASTPTVSATSVSTVDVDAVLCADVRSEVFAQCR